ncbi:MAG: mannosyltransferase [Flavobacteriaceae bacterium]
MSKYNFRKYLTPILFTVLLAVMYGSFAYDLVRSDFVKLISLFGALFFLSYQIIKMQGWNFKLLAGLGILFRLIFLWATPNLSQDFYRFIWDGRVLLQGYSPFLIVPQDYLQNPSLYGITISQAQELFQGMGNPSSGNFTNYPPVNQLFFAVAALLSGKSIVGSIVVLRIMNLLADVGILYFGRKLLKRLSLSPHLIFWYFLNPFVIIELTGNLHFEGVMVFFLTVSMLFLQKGKWFLSALFLGLSISTKLLPLMFLPLFLQWFWNKQRTFKKVLKPLLLFYAATLGTVLVTFLPFISYPFIENYLATNALWFQKFEFNASIYYLVRWIGFQVVGWNIIATAGKVLPAIVMVFILFWTFFKKTAHLKDLFTSMLFVISVYFLLSTTIHPWYVVTPLLICIFTQYRFPIVWSGVVMLSYYAYNKTNVEEHLGLVALEYAVVIGFAVWELCFKKKTNSQTPSLHPQNT